MKKVIENNTVVGSIYKYNNSAKGLWVGSDLQVTLPSLKITEIHDQDAVLGHIFEMWIHNVELHVDFNFYLLRK